MVNEDIDKALARMSREELLSVMQRLVELLRNDASRQPSSLRGALSGIADPDFDLDSAIGEARRIGSDDLE